MNSIRLSAILIIVVSSIGCANTSTLKEQNKLYDHVVAMDRNGSPIDVTNGNRLINEEFEKGQLQSIVKNVKKFLKENQDGSVMIYVHGAPLFLNYSYDDILKKYRDVQKSGNSWYPIFLRWEGTMHDVYSDHLFRIRQGQDAPIAGVLTAPFYLAADTLGTLAHALPAWAVLLNHIWRTEFPEFDSSGIKQEAKKRQLRENHAGSCENEVCKKVHISKTLNASPKVSPVTLVNGPIDTARLPPQLLLSPIIASFGSAMWTNYRRRARAAIWQTSEYTRERVGRLNGDSPSGALAMLVDAINKINKDVASRPKFILIGHSTGAIVLSELINSKLKEKNDVNFEKIVFLGAAATIDDFNKTIIPYLSSRQKENAKAKAEFYNISLNEYAEGKMSHFGITPSGTMLEWLDNAITKPADHTERVIGKWENMMLAIDTIPEKIRDRIHLKHLPYENGYPLKHETLDDIHKNFHPFKEEHWRVN